MTHDLSRILHKAPFGFSIETSDGTVVYSNEMSTGVREPTGDGACANLLDDQKHHVSIDGENYVVNVSLKAARHGEIEDELFRRAYFDELTGLPNRGLFEASIRALIATQPDSFAVAFVDLDGFKRINDYFGHDAGDQLLVRVAERLSASLHKADVLARLGGDEFVILLMSAAEADDVALRTQAICDALKRPYFIDGYEVLSSASIGVSMFPLHGKDYESLRRNADSAMYQCKGSSKGTVRLFDPSVQAATVERARMEQRLRLAIRDKQIRCAYQPKVNFRTQSVVGVEALLRWTDEEGIIHPPGDFVSLAIELGLMDDVTRLIVADAVSSTSRIDELFGKEASLSINIAAKQVEDARLMKSILDSVSATGCAERFMFEITEEAFFAKSRFQKHTLPLIREVGAKVSIDDFGVGYSSLAALADITADEIKVDRSFITDLHKRPRSQSILRAIESLGQSLGMSVIVEGVEKFEELAFLQAATRINCAQGYYFSRPMLLEDADIEFKSRHPASVERAVGAVNRHSDARGRSMNRG